MLLPASNSSSIFTRKSKLPAYFTAWELNNPRPVATANTKLVQVQGSICAASEVTVRSREARFNSRTSTMRMEPTVIVMASTCMVSMVGNNQVDSRAAVAKPVVSRVWRR